MPQILKDITGQRFNKLVAIKHIYSKKWLFKCDCGNETIMTKAHVKRNKTCGCERYIRKHGFANKIREYAIWKSIKGRCYNKSDQSYKKYGGRGIRVCDRWLESFSNFLSDIGFSPTKKHSIDRINNDGNYEPLNCRWATNTQQTRNQSSNIIILYKNQEKNLSEWCEILNLNYHTIYGRIKSYGWSKEKAISTPIRKITKRSK